jgi:hypothetical protein
MSLEQPALTPTGTAQRGTEENDMPDDFENCPIGTQIQLVRLKWALHQILTLESCLLAEAQEIAREALREIE